MPRIQQTATSARYSQIVRTILLYALGVLLVWLFAGRHVISLLDRVHALNLTRTPVEKLRFTGNTLSFAGVSHDILVDQSLPSGLNIRLGSNKRAAITYKGATFSAGPATPVLNPHGLPEFEFTPDPGDTVTYTTEQSHLSWPTPFEMNFMTGYTHSWRQYIYFRLVWTKRSGAHMQILWRRDRGYNNQNGWQTNDIRITNAALRQVSIIEAADLTAAAHAYLKRTKSWNPADYDLEDRGPAPDGKAEILAALHYIDKTASAPGAGLSLQLHLDFTSRQVTHETAFQ